jgi:GNAT superfamily N-acetyltransferase
MVNFLQDMHSDEPYLEADYGSETSECCYIDMIYVPPKLRGQGLGKKLVTDFIKNEIEPHRKRIRLKACDLGSGHTQKFWESLGFKKAYYGNTDSEWGDVDDIMVLGVNGSPTPKAQKLTSHNNSEREMHECKEDIEFLKNQKNNALEY